MASNIERLTIKDTFTNWRDKINGFIDIAVLAPMADEDGVMHIDVPHCNAREVVFDVPVRMEGDAWAKDFHCTGSFESSRTATTIQETMDAGFKLTGNEDYIPWISGQTQNGAISLYTTSYDDSLHFAYVDIEGELVNTFSWDPDTNMISARIDRSDKAAFAELSGTLQITDLTGTNLPGSYPVFFGPVDGNAGTGSMDNSLTYQPRTGTLFSPKFQGDLIGNAASASKAEKLTNARKLQLGMDATGYAIFDGTEDVTIPCKLNATGVIAGSYGPAANVNVPRTNRRFVVPSFRVDEKGRITQAFTRTVEFPYPEVDIDMELDPTSRNAVSNYAVAPRIANIETILESTPGMDPATPTSAGLMSAADKNKLNSLTQLPRISSVGMQIYDSTTNSIDTSDIRTLSTAKPSQLTINARNGIHGAVSIIDGQSNSEVAIDLSVELQELAGSGLVEDEGKLSVPKYAGPTASAAGTPGLVPSATNAQKNLFLNGAGQWADPVGTTYDPATGTTAGLMSAADKAKLDGIAAQADNVTFARTLTSGTKIGTITINGTATDIYGEKNTDTTYASFVGATASAAGKTGLVPVPAKGAQAKFLRGDATWQAVYDASEIDTKLSTKANLASPAFTGTPSVPNAAAGTNTTQAASTAFVTTAINNLKDGAPAGLDTLKEIATSIGNNTNFKKYVDDGLAGKLSTTSANYIKTLNLNGRTLSGTKGDGTSFSWTTVDTNTTYTNFVKSGSGAKAGLVPAPSTTAGSTKYLCENGTWTVPAMNADEKVKNTLNKTAKAYITGTTSGSTNTGGQVFDTGVFLTTAAGTLQATTFVGALNGNAKTATTLQTARTINGVAFNGSKNITVADSTKLPLTGGTLTGNLVVKKGAPYMYLQNTSMTKGSKPSSNQYSLIALTSSAGNANGNRIGLFQSSLNTAGNVTTGIYAYRNTKDATTNASVSVTYEAGGTAYANCPTPPAGDSSTKIATTAWVQNSANLTKLMTTINAVPSANVIKKGNNTRYTADKNGYIIFQSWNSGHCGRNYLDVNGMTFEVRDSNYGSGECGHNVWMTCPVRKGWWYKSRTSQGGCILWWMPC